MVSPPVRKTLALMEKIDALPFGFDPFPLT